MELAIVVGLMAVVMLIAGALVMIQRMRNEMDSREKDARMREEQAQMRERASSERERMAMDRLAQIEKRSNEMKMEMQLQFEHLSNKVLREQCATIDERNMRQLNQLLNPLKTRIEDFTRQAMEADIRQNATQKSLTDQLERLMNLNMSIGEEARNLTKALRNDSKTQGDWGESLLKELLEKSGLKEGIHFDTQVTRNESGQTLRNEEGSMLRPDFLLHLPGGREIVVDSKVSLTAFADYSRAETEEEKKDARRRLVQSVKSHIDEIATKNYQGHIKTAAEQALMFMPVEGAYFLAMDSDRSLTGYALKKKVVIVTPTHLMSVVQIIEQTWRIEGQDRNAAEIARLGGLIYDRLAMFMKDFENISSCIERTRQAYENSLRSLSHGSQSVIARANRMKELGAKTTRQIAEREPKD